MIDGLLTIVAGAKPRAAIATGSRAMRRQEVPSSQILQLCAATATGRRRGATVRHTAVADLSALRSHRNRLGRHPGRTRNRVADPLALRSHRNAALHPDQGGTLASQIHRLCATSVTPYQPPTGDDEANVPVADPTALRGHRNGPRGFQAYNSPAALAVWWSRRSRGSAQPSQRVRAPTRRVDAAMSQIHRLCAATATVHGPPPSGNPAHDVADLAALRSHRNLGRWAGRTAYRQVADLATLRSHRNSAVNI